MLHGTQDKLERHEMREKQLGEIVKRALGGLEKRHRSLEPIKGMLERLDERLAGVETILMQVKLINFHIPCPLETSLSSWGFDLFQNEERQRLQSIITNNTVDALVQSIETINTKVSATTKSAASSDSGALDKISSTVVDIKTTLNDLKKKVDGHDAQINKIDETTAKVIDVLTEKSGHVAVMLEKYENKLSEFNNRIPTEISPAISYKEPEFSSSQIETSLESQKKILENILKSISGNVAKIDNLPTLHDVNALANNTMFVLQELRYNMESKNSELSNTIAGKFKDTGAADYHDSTNKSITELAEFHKNIYSGIAKSYEELSNEIQTLSKIEKVVIQTGDNVLDVKRRIEYGVHQVISDVSEMVKAEDKDLKETVNKR